MFHPFLLYALDSKTHESRALFFCAKVAILVLVLFSPILVIAFIRRSAKFAI